MTKIYGFGNALIDIEVSISEEELSTLNIKKGSKIYSKYNKLYNSNIYRYQDIRKYLFEDLVIKD